MNNINFWAKPFLKFLLILIGIFFFIGKNIEAQNRPNILYIMGDDHTWQAIGSYHSFLSSVAHTPNIDHLRDQGALLTNVFCTNSICAPSRATIMTGQYSNKNGVYTLYDTLDSNHETVAKILHNHGYQTAIFGKWHLKSKPRGFDYFNIFSGQGGYHNPFLRNEENWPKGKRYKGFSSHIVADQALKWLKNRDKDAPFMLMVDFKATHEPFNYASRFDTLYQGRHMPEPKSLYNFWPDKSTHHFKWQVLEIVGNRFVKHPKKYQTEGFSLDGLNRHQRREKIYQTFIKHYLRSGATLDYNVGRILSFLEKHHLDKNTIVIYTSDQGYFLGEYGTDDKRVMYDPALRMPFIIRYPKEISAGSTDSAMVLNIDFAPLMLDYADIAKPNTMQGHSFRQILSTGKSPQNWRTALYYRYWMHQQHRPAHFGIRTHDYMLMFLYGQNLMHTYGSKPTDPVWEFYDLKKDPREVHNEYNNPHYKETIDQLKKQLLKLKHKAGDTVMIKKHLKMQKIMSKNFRSFNRKR